MPSWLKSASIAALVICSMWLAPPPGVHVLPPFIETSAKTSKKLEIRQYVTGERHIGHKFSRVVTPVDRSVGDSRNITPELVEKPNRLRVSSSESKTCGFVPAGAVPIA